jgi:site-specific recombinase XerD
MASIKLMLYTHKTLKDKSHPIIFSILKDRKRRVISLGYSATKIQWSERGQTVNAKHPKADELKLLIKKKKKAALKVIMELDGSSKPYTVDDIAESLGHTKKTSMLKEYADQLITSMKQTGRNGNARAYQDALNAFMSFNIDKDIDLKNINIRLLQRYQDALLEKGVKINSISIYLRTIRAIYNRAIRDEIISEGYYPFKNFKIRQESTIKRALSKAEINAIKELDLSNRLDLDFARNIFLFSFYNRGMNIIDIFYLKPDDIIDGRIRYRRQKTGQTFSIKITEQAQSIIEKYQTAYSKYVFPILEEGKEYLSYRNASRLLNKKLKDIGKDLELKMPLTSYVARHSWATIAKRSGIPTAVISEGMGHDSEQTTQIYLDSFEDETLDNANELIIG